MVKQTLTKATSSLKTLELNFLENTQKLEGVFAEKNRLIPGLIREYEKPIKDIEVEQTFSVLGEDFILSSNGWIYKKKGRNFSRFYYGIDYPIKKVIPYNFGEIPCIILLSGGYVNFIGGRNARFKCCYSCIEMLNGLLFAAKDSSVYFCSPLEFYGEEFKNSGKGAINLDPAFGKIVSLINVKNALYVFQEYAVSRLSAFYDSADFSLEKVVVLKDKISFSAKAVLDEVYFLVGNNIYCINGLVCKKIRALPLDFKPRECALVNSIYAVLGESNYKSMVFFYDTVSGSLTTIYKVKSISDGGLSVGENGELFAVKKGKGGFWQSKKISFNNPMPIVANKIILNSLGEAKLKIYTDCLVKEYQIVKGKNQIETELCVSEFYIEIQFIEGEDLEISELKVLYRD